MTAFAHLFFSYSAKFFVKPCLSRFVDHVWFPVVPSFADFFLRDVAERYFAQFKHVLFDGMAIAVGLVF